MAYSQDATAAPAAKDNTSNDNFRFGLFFAPNIGWAKTDSPGLSKGGGNLGFGFGLMAEFNLGSSNRYAFLTGLNVTKLNSSVVIPTFILSPEFDFKQTFAEIPLALKLKTNEIGYLTYFGKFGLTPGYRIKSTGSSGENLDDETTPIRMGLLIGIGTEYNISGSTNLSFGVDFNNGFTNMFTKDAGTDIKGNKLKAINNYIALNLGIFF